MRVARNVANIYRTWTSDLWVIGIVVFSIALGTVRDGSGEECGPEITVNLSDADPYDIVSGVVTGVNPDQVRVVVFVRTNRWYIQPYEDERAYTEVGADGTYETWIRDWRQISIFLVREGYDVLAEQEPYRPSPLSVNCVDVLAVSAYPTVRFSGYEWAIKGGDGLGPGPNSFSSSDSTVWVDDQDRLHLRISRRGGRWYCAEVYLLQSLGYGTYTFYLSSRVDLLDRRVVGSPFIYEDDTRELDVEFSRWDVEGGPNAQFVVQPWNIPEHREQFYMGLDGDHSTHQIVWRPGSVRFRSTQGDGLHPPPGRIIHEWMYEGGDVPEEGDERGHINLWLLHGEAPSDDQEAEMVLRAFEWTPLRLYGDVTGDGEITAYDASWILEHTVGARTLVGPDSVAADVSGMSGISPYDASLILQYAVDIIDRFPVE